jgi:Domain of unknown function (DUF4157)
MLTTARALTCVDDKATVPARGVGTEVPTARSRSSVYQTPARTVAMRPLPSQISIRPAVTPTAVVQRMCADCEQGRPCMGAAKTLQTAGRASSVPVREAAAEAHGLVRGGGGQPLDERIRAEMEARLGGDFSSVRIHTGVAAARSAAGVRARAYTVGDAVVFGAGGYAPTTSEGRRTLAHELVHVQQQRQGPVSGTDMDSGIAISDPGDRFEREAESVADQALRIEGAPHRQSGMPDAVGTVGGKAMHDGSVGPVIQRQLYPPMPVVITPPQPNQPVVINAVDARQETATPWYLPWRYTGPLTNLFRGDVTMTSVSTMADAVLKFAGVRLINRLNVIDHGNEDGVEIGDDWLATPDDVKRFAAGFARLKGHFTGDGFVHMQNCHAGKNQALICALGAAFGVPVFAGTGFHNPLLGFNFGDYVSCGASGTWNPNAGRPSTPSPPLFPLGREPTTA